MLPSILGIVQCQCQKTSFHGNTISQIVGKITYLKRGFVDLHTYYILLTLVDGNGKHLCILGLLTVKLYYNTALVIHMCINNTASIIWVWIYNIVQSCRCQKIHQSWYSRLRPTHAGFLGRCIHLFSAIFL